MIELQNLIEPYAKRLPKIKKAMQKHHDFYLGLKPDKIKGGDEAQVALARQREENGEVLPLEPTPLS